MQLTESKQYNGWISREFPWPSKGQRFDDTLSLIRNYRFEIKTFGEAKEAKDNWSAKRKIPTQWRNSFIREISKAFYNVHKKGEPPDGGWKPCLKGSEMNWAGKQDRSPACPCVSFRGGSPVPPLWWHLKWHVQQIVTSRVNPCHAFSSLLLR